MIQSYRLLKTQNSSLIVTKLRARSFRCNTTTRCQQDDTPQAPKKDLVSIIKRKQQDIQRQMTELGEEAVEERLKSVQDVPPSDPHRLARIITECTMVGRPAYLVEACRGPSITTPEALAEHAAFLVQCGADAIVIRTDLDETPSGTADLFAVCKSLGANVPIIMRDWIIHPLQIVDARTAGCCACVGVIASVMNKAAPVLSSFGSAIGLDCPVEIVNTAELKAMEQYGVPFYGMNLSVGLSIGFGAEVAQGLVKDLPFGSLSVIGVKSLEEGKKARLAGADALLIKDEAFADFRGQEARFMTNLRMLTDGDD